MNRTTQYQKKSEIAEKLHMHDCMIVWNHKTENNLPAPFDTKENFIESMKNMWKISGEWKSMYYFIAESVMELQ